MNAQQAGATCALANRPVICVSHGFQTNYERGFCNGLVATGLDVTLIASDRTDFAGLHPNVRAVNLRGSQTESRSRLAKLLNLVRYHLSLMGYALLRPRSVVHVMGLMWPVFLCGVLQGMWFRIVCWRYVLTVHDLLPAVQGAERYRRWCRWAYRLPHQLVVHTPLMKEALLRDFGVPARRVTVMEHGIEPHLAAAFEHRAAPVQSIPLLVAFGAVTTRKGTDLLLQALARIDTTFRLVIAGVCVDQVFRARLQSMLADHPYRSRIEWRDGFLEEPEANALLQAADVLVLPYRHIDQSGVLFQAFRFGIPVVATRVGQFERYVSSEVGELAPADDVDGLQQALLRWYQRWQECPTSPSRARIREIGRAFEWTATVSALAHVYGGALAPEAASR